MTGTLVGALSKKKGPQRGGSLLVFRAAVNPSVAAAGETPVSHAPEKGRQLLIRLANRFDDAP
jgi:hypothetical protein